MKTLALVFLCGSTFLGCVTNHGPNADRLSTTAPLAGKQYMGIRPILLAGSADLNSSIIVAIQTGDQPTIDRYTVAFLNGEVQLPEAFLRDRRPFGKATLVIWCPDEGKGESHYYYGVERICDYFLCLLESKYRLDSRDILHSQGVPLPPGCRDHEEQCWICNSRTYPIDDTLRDSLVKYWLEKQASRYSCSPPVWVTPHR